MTEPHRPWEVHGTTEYTPEMVEALKTMHLIRGVPVPAILTNVGSDQAEPATPVTVTLPADTEYLRGWRDAMQCIADWADDKMEHAENSATDAEWGNEIAETFSLVSALASQSIRVPERARQAFFTRTPVPAPVVSGDAEAARDENHDLTGGQWVTVATQECEQQIDGRPLRYLEQHFHAGAVAAESVRQQHECDATLVAEYHKAYATIAKLTAERDTLLADVARLRERIHTVDHYNATSKHLDRIRELEAALRERTDERNKLAAGSVPVDPETTQPADEPRGLRPINLPPVNPAIAWVHGGLGVDSPVGATQGGDQT